MPTLKCFAVLCYENETVSKAAATGILSLGSWISHECSIDLFCSNIRYMLWIFSATYNGESIPNLLLRLLSRDKPSEMQMAAAKCLTYLCRGGAIPTHCPTIQNKVWTAQFVERGLSIYLLVTSMHRNLKHRIIHHLIDLWIKFQIQCSFFTRNKLHCRISCVGQSNEIL